MAGLRLDQWLVQRGLAGDADKAQRMIRAGKVKVDGHLAAKPGLLYPDGVEITLETPARFVSRGGEKLEAAMVHFALTVPGEVCLDIGASTGGFTDCLLQRGARRVYAVDVGRNQLHPRVATDARVVVMDGVNARNLAPTQFPELATFATIDASFISLGLILPAVARVLAPAARLVTLIKPQFEAEPAEVKHGGVVRDVAVHERVIDRIQRTGQRDAGLTWQGVCTSPLRGPAGNIEYLAYWTRP
jgi:23S rRNA (cytidine1920-2'-O)/16S rRNA (cytidine1409-2'-O)-methyltransferase